MHVVFHCVTFAPLSTRVWILDVKTKCSAGSPPLTECLGTLAETPLNIWKYTSDVWKVRRYEIGERVVFSCEGCLYHIVEANIILSFNS